MRILRRGAVFILVWRIYSDGLVAHEITTIAPTAVGRTKRVVIAIDFDSVLTQVPDATKLSLVAPGPQQVYCTDRVAIGSRLRLIFQVTSADFQEFESLVADSSGFYLMNEEPIVFGGDTLGAGELEEMTKGRLRTIASDDWRKYILDEYSAQYFFPHTFSVGSQLGLSDSTRTAYFVSLVQSGNWYSGEGYSVYWAVKGRWSTDSQDRLNFAQFYPFTLQYNGVTTRAAVMTGVEAGYTGFGRLGRATLVGQYQFHLPFNPVDLTLGHPRWRLNPVLTLAAQGGLGWGSVRLPDSVKRSIDGSLEFRYDIPIAAAYYLQTRVKGFYSTVTRQAQYAYEVSLGYVTNGDLRIMALYQQGYQGVTYQYDRKLLLAFAFDMLNEIEHR